MFFDISDEILLRKLVRFFLENEKQIKRDPKMKNFEIIVSEIRIFDLEKIKNKKINISHTIQPSSLQANDCYYDPKFSIPFPNGLQLKRIFFGKAAM